MPVNDFNLQVQCGWNVSRLSPPFQSITNASSVPFDMNGLNLTIVDCFVQNVELLTGVSQDFNLNIFFDPAGTAFTATKGLSLFFLTTGDSTAKLRIAASPTNGLTWIFSSGGYNEFPAGGMWAFALNAGNVNPQAISASAGSLRLSNTGTGRLEVTMVALAAT